MTNAEFNLLNWALNQPMSGFYGKLFDLMSKADSVNLERLAAGYPDEVAAFRRYKSEPDYFDSLRAKAGR